MEATIIYVTSPGIDDRQVIIKTFKGENPTIILGKMFDQVECYIDHDIIDRRDLSPEEVLEFITEDRSDDIWENGGEGLEVIGIFAGRLVPFTTK